MQFSRSRLWDSILEVMELSLWFQLSCVDWIIKYYYDTPFCRRKLSGVNKLNEKQTEKFREIEPPVAPRQTPANRQWKHSNDPPDIAKAFSSILEDSSVPQTSFVFSVFCWPFPPSMCQPRKPRPRKLDLLLRISLFPLIYFVLTMSSLIFLLPF